ncbi:hypothetical protein IE81DRAFT_159544 [Ceraceosorus guamensis]|uniref:Uncharacterized protein n=1 Tax=Ceraceosorus guamensis TaxID=1522189 RepID=A0A316VZ32_9BASI|nr:hypothetical protein IE81DRAFT_159544 [Ceraceosorus guamensis]PWN41653.1 hypothetical protein IE81DRAFT_159544 [Ceraceosorus guamensis]
MTSDPVCLPEGVALHEPQEQTREVRVSLHAVCFTPPGFTVGPASTSNQSRLKHVHTALVEADGPRRSKQKHHHKLMIHDSPEASLRGPTICRCNSRE